MKERLDYRSASPESYKAVLALELYVSRDSGLEPRLRHLLKIRASQINGCAFCLDMHVKEARKDGLDEQWIALIATWRESPLYDARERALLGWTETLTRVSETGAPDSDFEALQAHFSDEEITKLTVAVGMINMWNRLAVAFRSPHPIDAAA